MVREVTATAVNEYLRAQNQGGYLLETKSMYRAPTRPDDTKTNPMGSGTNKASHATSDGTVLQPICSWEISPFATALPHFTPPINASIEAPYINWDVAKKELYEPTKKYRGGNKKGITPPNP